MQAYYDAYEFAKASLARILYVCVWIMHARVAFTIGKPQHREGISYCDRVGRVNDA